MIYSSRTHSSLRKLRRKQRHQPPLQHTSQPLLPQLTSLQRQPTNHRRTPQGLTPPQVLQTHQAQPAHKPHQVLRSPLLQAARRPLHLLVTATTLSLSRSPSLRTTLTKRLSSRGSGTWSTRSRLTSRPSMTAPRRSTKSWLASRVSTASLTTRFSPPTPLWPRTAPQLLVSSMLSRSRMLDWQSWKTQTCLRSCRGSTICKASWTTLRFRLTLCLRLMAWLPGQMPLRTPSTMQARGSGISARARVPSVLSSQKLTWRTKWLPFPMTLVCKVGQSPPMSWDSLALPFRSQSLRISSTRSLLLRSARRLVLLVSSWSKLVSRQLAISLPRQERRSTSI